MAKTDFKTVAEYIATQPKAAQAAPRRVRAAIRKALSAAEELISHRIPAYRLHSTTVVFFADWKHHYSLYPATFALRASARQPRSLRLEIKGWLAEP